MINVDMGAVSESLSKANCSDMKKVPLPMPAKAGRVNSRLPAEAPCFWMK